MRFRHFLGLLAVAALLVFIVEPLAFSGTTPLLSRLEAKSRIDFFEQIVPVSASLLGFYIAAVAILASLDPARKIVEELKRGESFSLLIANMLAAILVLFLLTFLGVAGSVLDPGGIFRSLYEWVTLVALFELALSGFYFSVVTYKVAVKQEPVKPLDKVGSVK